MHINISKYHPHLKDSKLNWESLRTVQEKLIRANQSVIKTWSLHHRGGILMIEAGEEAGEGQDQHRG